MNPVHAEVGYLYGIFVFGLNRSRLMLEKFNIEAIVFFVTSSYSITGVVVYYTSWVKGKLVLGMFLLQLRE